MTFKADDEFLPTRTVRARYGGKSEKTIERWVARGVLPQPDWINGRRYWRRSVLEQHERAGMGSRKEKNS
jgi:hypothetical protein